MCVARICSRRSSLPRWGLLLLLPLALLAGGCFATKAEGEALRRDVEQLKAELAKKTDKAEKERIKLQKVMEQATNLLTRNSADVGAQVERIQDRQDKLSGEVEEAARVLQELQKIVSELKGRVEVKLDDAAISQAPAEPSLPTDKNELFKLAEAKLAAGAHKEARSVLTQWLKLFPKDKLVPSAHLLYGNSYYAEENFAPAIVKYKPILEQYKKSAAYPEALFQTGMSFYQLKFCTDADLWLKQFLTKYKRHAQAAKATKVRGLIKKFSRNKDYCR